MARVANEYGFRAERLGSRDLPHYALFVDQGLTLVGAFKRAFVDHDAVLERIECHRDYLGDLDLVSNFRG